MNFKKTRGESRKREGPASEAAGREWHEIFEYSFLLLTIVDEIEKTMHCDDVGWLPLAD
jgi:hypothetical protein